VFDIWGVWQLYGDRHWRGGVLLDASHAGSHTDLLQLLVVTFDWRQLSRLIFESQYDGEPVPLSGSDTNDVVES